MYGMTIGFGMIAGQLLGGLLVSAKPVRSRLAAGVSRQSAVWCDRSDAGVVAGAGIARAGGLKLDPVGVVLVTTALALLLYPLIRGAGAGWPAWTWASLAGAAVLLVVFARYERRKTDRDGSPLVVLSLFRHRSFVIGLGVGLSFFTVLAPFLVCCRVSPSGLDLSPRARGPAVSPVCDRFPHGVRWRRRAWRHARAEDPAARRRPHGHRLATLIAIVHSATLDTSSIAYIARC